MGLFDDILKKPVNQPAPSDPLTNNTSAQGGGQSGSQGGGQSQQTNPTDTIFIQKTSEETIFGPETEARSIEKENAPSPMPTVHAEADTSSILISMPTPTTPMITAEPVMIESVSMMSNPAPISPTVMITPTEDPVYTAPVAMIPTEPMITPAESVAQEPMTVGVPTINMDPISPVAPVQTPATAPAPAVTNSIFDSIMNPSEPAPAFMPQEVAPVGIAPTPMITTAAPSPITPTPSVEVAAPVVFSSTHNFSTPREFIEKSIANIDTMLVNIDSRHDAKEREEESYRTEKLRFTDLEKNAHTQKIIMDKERDHAIHMRKILETELERDTANKATAETHANHVESTLTEIGTEHPVHRHTHKKAESHPHEESPISA